MRTLALALACLVFAAPPVRAQSVPTKEMFDAAAEGAGGNHITRDQCRVYEKQESAVWVVMGRQGWCLRYYASGLKAGNGVVVGWLHGDIAGSYKGRGPAGHQDGLGVAVMVEQERRLSATYGVPFVFLGRPGAYGSGGDHRKLASTRLEAELVAAQVETITKRYGIRSWVLGGHSGGGTLVSALLARRADIRCAVISSGAGAYNDWLRVHDQPFRIKPNNLNAIDDVGSIPRRADVRIIVMGDPRDTNVVWPVQTRFYDAVKGHGLNATLLPLQRGRPPEFHSLVDLAETATGLCAQGVSDAEIRRRLLAMPPQAVRVSN
jgi:pimeloyl-ACP methyl ester carboxylesterase